MILRLLFLTLTLSIPVSADGKQDSKYPDKWGIYDLQEFSMLEPEKADSVFRSLVAAHPPHEIEVEAGYQLGLNQKLREWLPSFFESQPVLWENYSERNNILFMVRHIRAEWSLRFLLELSLDDRPMKSLKYDYDDPTFFDEMKKRAQEGHVEDAERSLMMSGYSVHGKNENLARENLNSMALAGAPPIAEIRKGAPPVDSWLQAGKQREQIPEIVRETWGERAVLNADLGLGPDNKPLSVSSGATPPERGSPAIGKVVVEGMNEVGEEGKIGAPLMIALIILAISGIFALLAKRRSA